MFKKIFFKLFILLLPIYGFAQGKIYQIVFNVPYAPFVQRNGDGSLMGFEIDLLNAIAKKQGIEMKYKSHPWSGLFDTLNNGQSDMVASGITITEERSKTFDFSRPYYQSSQALLLNKGLNQYASLAEIKGKNIVVQKDSTSEYLLEKQSDISNNIQHQNGSIYLCVRQLLANKADIVVSDSGPLAFYANEYHNKGLQFFIEPNAPKEYYGFVFKKDSPFKNMINQGLNKIIADGTYNQIYQKWFHQKPDTAILTIMPTP